MKLRMNVMSLVLNPLRSFKLRDIVSANLTAEASNASGSYTGGVLFESVRKSTTILPQAFRDFFQCLQANARIVPKN